MLRVKNPGRLDSMAVLEHVLIFGADGWANGDELTAQECERLRRFHFTLLETQETASEEVEEAAAETLFDAPESVSPKPARAKSTTNRRKAGER